MARSEGEEGALAVGAGDMDDRRQLLLGMAEGREQTLDAPERRDRSIAGAASSGARAACRLTRPSGGAQRRPALWGRCGQGLEAGQTLCGGLGLAPLPAPLVKSSSSSIVRGGLSSPLPESAMVEGGAFMRNLAVHRLGDRDVASRACGGSGDGRCGRACRGDYADAPPCRPCRGRGGYSARWKPFGSCSRMVCSITRGPAKPISAPGSAIWMSPSMA